MMKIKQFFWTFYPLYVILFFIFVNHLNAYSDTFFVSPNGNDNNSGTEEQPWQTIEKAAMTLAAGDTVFIKEGTYEEKVNPQNSGGEDNYITYAIFEGDEVVIDGKNITLSRDADGLFHIFEKSFIKISGLKIINAGPNRNNAGIFVNNSSHIIIENNHTFNTVSSGIGVWDSDNIIIDGNEVELACNDGEQECITVAITDIFEVKNNHVHDNGAGTIGGEGIDVKDGSTNGKVYNNHVHDLNNRPGIYVDSWDKHSFNIEVFQNVVHDIRSNDGIPLTSECGGLLENVNVYNNVVYDCDCSGMGILAQGCIGKAHPMKDIKIINNTIYNNGSNNCFGNTWGGAITLENPEAENVVIKNNICSQNLVYQISADRIVPESNYIISNNLIDAFRDEIEDETRGTDFIEGDPGFVNASAADFHLLKDSPAIDKGSTIDAPDFDFAGTDRPQGDGIDIGAFEFTDDDIVVTPTPEITSTLTPEPTLKPTPTPTTTPVDEKSFTFKCKRNFSTGPGGFEKLVLELNEQESCTLRLTRFNQDTQVAIATSLRTGFRTSISVETEDSVTDENGEIEFIISAVEKGIDWIAWALPDEDGNYEFNRKAYDNGVAWGMFVEVR